MFVPQASQSSYDRRAELDFASRFLRRKAPADVIEQMEKNGTSVKVSDISDALNLPRPGVTRTVKEMEQKGYLTKKPSEEDARILYLFITDEGKKLSAKYNEQVFNALLPDLETISGEDAECTVRTIEIFYRVMCERRNDLDK